MSIPDAEVMTAMAYEWRSEVSLRDHRPREPPVTVISTPRHRLACKKFLGSLRPWPRARALHIMLASCSIMADHGMLLLVNGELFRCQHAICSHATCDRDTCRSQFTLWAVWMIQLPPPRRASVCNAVVG
jgi:hypothetical protein